MYGIGFFFSMRSSFFISSCQSFTSLLTVATGPVNYGAPPPAGMSAPPPPAGGAPETPLLPPGALLFDGLVLPLGRRILI